MGLTEELHLIKLKVTGAGRRVGSNRIRSSTRSSSTSSTATDYITFSTILHLCTILLFFLHFFLCMFFHFFAQFLVQNFQPLSCVSAIFKSASWQNKKGSVMSWEAPKKGYNFRKIRGQGGRLFRNDTTRSGAP